MERSIDFAMPLHHSPIYQSLLHDLLGLESNHVSFKRKNDKKAIPRFLDPEQDHFWRQNANEALPKVHEYHSKILTHLQTKQDEIANKGNNASSPTISDEFDEKKQSENDFLKSTIKSLPQLLQKKEEVALHGDLMSSLSDILSQRAISEYFHLEEALMHSKVLNAQQTASLKQQLSGTNSMGIIEDKLRLFLIFYLCHHNASSGLNELIDTLLSNENLEKYLHSSSKFKIKALQYIVSHKKFLNLAESVMENEENAQKTESGWSAWLESGQSIFSKIKGMLPTSGKCAVTRITQLLMNTDAVTSSVHSLTNPQLKNVNKNYLTFDPVAKGKNLNLDQINSADYHRAIVFVVGGGCFAEYANLNEFASNKHKNIIYGCTDLVSPNDFLTQLSNLGQQ